ncbi:MAG: indole-3-glycerol phosphate synthase TrpC [Bdellovibrionaceae bacterium]|nr:indole-3-glycerol phosphate synthase TrpC [Pseudobdellovibrionaceae bacterium]
MKPTELFLPKVARVAAEQLQLRRLQISEAKLTELSENRPQKIDFIQALRNGPRPRIIAEVKRKSPSLGPLAMDLDPCNVALGYARAGASAISVLTESTFFGGSHEDLRRIRQVLPNHPLLLKDFVVDHYQILEASAYGADAVLLIHNLLGPEKTRDFYSFACRLGLTPLIEVHDPAEFADAVSLGARLIGVNNRNLATLKTDLNVSSQLISSQISVKESGITMVSESGLNTAQDIKKLDALGFDAYLIGTSLMRNRNPETALSELLKNFSTDGPDRETP